MYFVIDIGASKTLFALFSNRGKILKTKKFPTEKSEAIYLEYLSENLDSFIEPKKRKKVKSIVVALPGVIKETFSPEKAEQFFCSITYGNLPWEKMNLFTPINKLFSCKISFINDADLATLYESSFYKKKSVTYLTFSTGIGGGIAENCIITNKSKTFEPGHKKYRFEEEFKEWEDIASAKAISEEYANTPIKNLKHNKSAIRDIALRVSLGLPDVITDTNPDVIVIGGAVGFVAKKLKKYLIPLIKLALEAKILKHKASKAQKTTTSTSELLKRVESLKIVPAKRPLESVIYGGFIYAKRNR